MLRGAAILLALAAACAAGSLVPLVGVLFVAPLPDLLFAGLALLVAGILPLHRWLRVVVALLVWAGLSLCSELERLPQHRAGFGGVFRPEIRRVQPLQVEPGRPLSLAGNLNPFLVAAGPAGFASIDTDQGARATYTLLVNRAEAVDPIEILWSQGHVPAIGRAGYPRVVVNRTHTADGWTRLQVVAEAAPGVVAAEFRRSFAVPASPPGQRASQPRRFLLGIGHDNLLRVLLGWNEYVRVERELAAFLASVLPQTARRPMRELQVVEDLRLPLPVGKSAESFLRGRDGVRRPAPGERNGCLGEFSYREWGRPGSSVGAVVPDAPEGADLLETRQSPQVPLDWACDPATGRLLSFALVSEEKVLRVAGYGRDGKLLEIHYFAWQRLRMPALDRTSLQRGPQGHLQFAVLSALPAGNDPRQPDNTAYRRTVFAVPPLQ